MKIECNLKISIYPLDDHRYESSSELAKELRGKGNKKYKTQHIRELPLPQFEVAETYTPKTRKRKYYLKELKAIRTIGNQVFYEIIHSEEVEVGKKIVQNNTAYVILKNDLKKLGTGS